MRCSLTDAMLCADGPVTSLAKSEHRRGHGALRDGVNQGRADIERFRDVVARHQVPRCDNDRIVLTIDVTNSLHALFHSEAGKTVDAARHLMSWSAAFFSSLRPIGSMPRRPSHAEPSSALTFASGQIASR
jgi:hypothetical protein